MLLYRRIKAIANIGKINCIFVLREEWETRDIKEAIEKLKKADSKIKEIDYFLHTENIDFLVVIDDDISGSAYAEALPMFRIIRLPLSLLLGLYPRIYHGLDFKIVFTIMHEYAHICIRHIIAKSLGFFRAYTIPIEKEETICDGISVMFIHSEILKSLISRCLYVKIKWLAYSTQLEELISKLYNAISTAALLESKNKSAIYELLTESNRSIFSINIEFQRKSDRKYHHFLSTM